jgi:hypothetical protein
MNRLQDNSYSSPALDMHVQPSFDHVQNLQLYRKLVENVLVPNSNVNFPFSPCHDHALMWIDGFQLDFLPLDFV